MRIDVITLFPEAFAALRDTGVVGRAFDRGQASLHLWNLRDYAPDRHRSVDDRAYGGGPGMVLRPDVLCACIDAVQAASAAAPVALMSPQGRRLDQPAVQALATRQRLILVAGRYEGVDERAIDLAIDEEWSIGDYVLSGGELPAMVTIDAVVRQLPGVLGHAQSAAQDSFSDGLLDCPHYTRPEVFRDRAVPVVLRSGNHAAIHRWREMQALGRTAGRRPDLLAKRTLQEREKALLEEYNALPPDDAAATRDQ